MCEYLLIQESSEQEDKCNTEGGIGRNELEMAGGGCSSKQENRIS